jgi:hypothetical protein
MLGLLSAKTTIFERCYPLGLSVVASSPKKCLAFALIGSILGYITCIRTGSSIRYIAACLIIIAIKWALSDFKKIKNHPVYIFLLTFVPSFSTGLALAVASGINFNNFTLYFIESILASGASYAFKKGFEINLKSKKLDSATFICAIFVLSIIILPFIDLKIFSVSVINPLLIALVLVFAGSFGVNGGAPAGLGLSILYMFAHKNPSSIVFASISGAIAGFFSPMGKVASCLSVLFSSLVIHYQLKTSFTIFEISEIIIGIALYFVVPKNFNLKSLVSQKPRTSSRGIQEFIYQRLSAIGLVLDRIKGFIDEISVRFGNHDSKILVQTHLEIFSNICKEISNKIDDNFLVNEENSAKIRYFIERSFKTEAKVACVENEFKHTFVQIDLPKDFAVNFEPLSEEVAYICGKPFSKPEFLTTNDILTIRFCEKPIFKTRVNSCQHARRKGRYCGDSFRNFSDGFGAFFVILSDGMGTGGEAAISSEMATETMSRMVQAGAPIESALEITNSSLMVKSLDESLATLDIFKFDLFSGSASFIKMGAAATFIKKEDEIIKIRSETLPAGIFPRADFKEIKHNLTEGDTVLIVSDGVTDIGDKWIKEEIISCNHLENLAQIIVNAARSKRDYENDDDITAVSVSIAK